MRTFLLSTVGPTALFAPEGKSGFTDEELASLSEEERKGLLDETLVDDAPEGDAAKAAEGKAAAEPEAGKAEEKKDEPKPEASKVDEVPGMSDAEIDAAAAAAVAAATGKPQEAKPEPKTTDEDPAKSEAEKVLAAAAAKDEGKKEGDPAPEAEEERSTVPGWTLPADHEAKLTKIAEDKAALAEKFDKGDLSATEFMAEQDKLLAAERDLHDQRLKASIGNDMRLAQWTEETVPAFFEQHPEYAGNELLHSMLDREVRKLQDKAIEDGKSQFAKSFLDTAHANITKSLGAMLGKKDGAATPKTPAVPVPTRPDIPPTLARVPAAEASEAGEANRFAVLDKLADENPEAFQRALEKLPADVRDAYMAAQ